MNEDSHIWLDADMILATEFLNNVWMHLLYEPLLVDFQLSEWTSQVTSDLSHLE